MVIPPEYAAVVERLFSSPTVQIGLSDRQQIVMYDGPTLISTRTADETYPSALYDRVEADGEVLFTAPKRKLLDSFRLALQTTKEDMVGINSTSDFNGNGIQLNIPNAIIEAELSLEVDVSTEFSRTFFSLPFLIKCLSSFEEDTVYVERLNTFNGAWRIGTGTEEFTILQPIQYDEPR